MEFRVCNLRLFVLLFLLTCHVPAPSLGSFDLNQLPEEAEQEGLLAEQQGLRDISLPKVSDSSKSLWRQVLDRAATSTVSVSGRLARLGSFVNKLPEYFDFGAFQRRFGRKYESAAELVYRRSVFLTNCLQMFTWRVKHRVGQADYQLGVNKFADRSPNEFRRIFMSAPPYELRPANQTAEEYFANVERVTEERASWDNEIMSQATGEPENMPAPSDLELEGVSVVFNEKQAERLIEAMLAQQRLPDGGQSDELDPQQLEEAMWEELEGADESSQSAGVESDPVDSLELPPPGQWRSLPAGGQPHRQRGAELVEPGTGLNWSKHKCFHMIYNQGDKCGKCYVMAATSLAEFYKCAELPEDRQEPRKFSKDYVMHCAQKYTPTVMGCAGGSLLDTLRFIGEAGVHNIGGWREHRQRALAELQSAGGLQAVGLDSRCPLDPLLTPVKRWGSIRVDVEPEPVAAASWMLALRDGPIAVSVQMPSVGVSGYVGGVHDGAGCATSGNWHAMILVGYGRDSWDKPAYWRFRNSWGDGWGEKGHFRLSMSAPAECLAGGVRLYRV